MTDDRATRRTASGYLVCDSALGLIGATPLVRLSKLSPDSGATIWAKAEMNNLGGSVKDRPALKMIESAEQTGALKPGATVVEATSGNTGISLALICARRGYRCVLVMPEDMSVTRRYLLKAYGAEVLLTAAPLGMSGAVSKAQELQRETPDAFMPSQFENPANPQSHQETTGVELLEQAPEDLRALVAGVGTGGTVTGLARALKPRFPALQIVAVEPAASAVLSGGRPAMHGIQGLGAGFVPKILDRSLVDRVIGVSDVAAERMTSRLAKEEGLLVGISAGANLVAAREVARELSAGSVVTILCDTGERYLA